LRRWSIRHDPLYVCVLSICNTKVNMNQSQTRFLINSKVGFLLISPKNEREAPGFRHGEESGCGFNRLQYFLI
jgi:hypothetical protein